jgi:NAD(P)-dependent dehydrogenase (short-subunit alcohol dehydrogenase family)
MDLGLKGKIALVTGAGSQIGFGKGICLTLAKEGCDVIVNDIKLDDAKKTSEEVKKLGRKSIAIKADVTKKEEVDAMAKAAIDIFTKQLATVEAKSGIRVNCVAPGPSPTNFIKAPNKQAVIDMLVKSIPMGKATTPADIANAVAFFASDISGDITGQVLQISGGSVL